MKGDFSRNIFDATKHYTSVLMQQGRVQLDADWNEQRALDEHRTLIEARDVIGACGGPRAAAGFLIRSNGQELTIGPGRYYVDGMLCENEREVDFAKQPDLPNTPDIRAAMEQARVSLGIVYLDVWQRHVTALDDPRLRETALGGPDTTTRVQTVWQVKVLPVNENERGGEQLRELVARREALQARIDEGQRTLELQTEQVAQLQLRLAQLPPSSIQRQRLLQQLARMEAAITQLRAEIEATTTERATIEREIALLRERGQVNCDTAFTQWDALSAPRGTLNARTQPPEADNNPCLLPPSAGYQRLENQLYRVEVHQGGPIGSATFKWSRDNGTVATTIERIGGSTITVGDLGPDEVLGFAHGQWIEISDAGLELNNLPGQLARIDTVNAATREITLLDTTPTPLATTESGVDPLRHPKLRRWDFADQPAAPADERGVASSGDWQPLEDGIAVQFSSGEYRTGDYWLIPARTGTGEIEWPPFVVPNTAPQPQPPLGIKHHYCRLALLRLDDGSLNIISDCRNIFDPLTEQQSAMHVVNVSWRNDDLFDLRTFVQTGLRITLDAPPDPVSVSESSVQLEMEMPAAGANGDANGILFNRTVIRGDVSVDPEAPNVIIWRYNEQPNTPNIRGAITPPTDAAQPIGTAPRPRRGAAAAAAATRRVSAIPSTYRIRVMISGRHIWQNVRRRLYLDGQVFGEPGQRRGGQPCSAIGLPSGDGARASDFESWFFLGGEQLRNALQVDRIRLLRMAGREIEAGAFDLPVSAPPIIDPGEQNVVEITFSRAVNPDGFTSDGRQTVRLALLSGAQEKLRFSGALSLQDNIARLTLREPAALTVGRYRLTVFAVQTDEHQPVLALDDGSALDGNFDNQPGENCVIDFAIR